MLIQIAFDLGIGINKARSSPRNMACLPGEDYSSTSLGLGCVYLVPVLPYITTQDDFFEVHASRHNKKKELIDGEDYEKGKHTHPELRKGFMSDAELQKEAVQERFIKLGGVGIVSPQKAVELRRNTTIFFNKDESAGVKGVNHKKSKRWKALPCHGHHGKRAASAVFDEPPCKRLRPCE
jgi:hypothetical protein